VCGKTGAATEGVVSVNAGFSTPASKTNADPSKPTFMNLLGIVDYF
jgi:hypothetical protein